MRYFLDCEFDGFGGPLLSLALIREDNEAIYIIYQDQLDKVKDPWVKENVLPIIMNIPSPIPGMAYWTNHETGAHIIAQLLHGDPDPVIITDWPDDVAYFCKAIMTGPGMMVNIPGLKFEVRRVDAWPSKLTERYEQRLKKTPAEMGIGLQRPVQHNSYWDAQALRVLVMDLL